ncbi:MAG: response regulator [Candidatus Contendobacter sp.]
MPVQHVLVVDDSKSARLMLRKILQSLGMTVDTVDSGEAALDYLRNQRPDVIFMDHTMPGMDGLMTLRRIQETPETATIPVAMYTSKDEPSYRNEAHAAGAVDVLSKPATLEALGQILERMSALLDPHSGSSAVLASAGEGITAEWIEKLVIEKAERVFYDSVESQVLPLLNDVIAKLRRELNLAQEEASQRVAAQIVDARLAGEPPSALQEGGPVAEEMGSHTQWNTLLEERLAVYQREERLETERLTREIAAQVSQEQLHTFTNQLVKPLTARFAEELQKASASTREATLEAAREVARETVQQALSAMQPPAVVEQVNPEATLEAAREVARETVQQALSAMQPPAERPAREVARMMRELWGEAKDDLHQRIYMAAGWAAAAGIGAAVLAYLLK